MYDLLIISAGKLGREMYGWVQDAIADGAPWKFKGFLDDRPGALQPFEYEEIVVGPVETYKPAPRDRFLCAVGDPAGRSKYSRMVRAGGGEFATLVHPTVVVRKRTRIKAGAVICPFVSIGAEVEIGDSTVVGPHSTISHDNNIGACCLLSGHAGFGGNVTVEDQVFVGLGAIVVPGVTIRAQSFVGAGSVVLQEVSSGTKVFGNPAVPIGKVQLAPHA